MLKACPCTHAQTDAALKTTRATLASKEEKLRAMGKQACDNDTSLQS